jgi:uncharacterized repeat protein (TIGR04138 family)
MKRPDFAYAVSQILEKDNRYHPDAYEFVSEALDYTVKMYKKPPSGPQRHVTAVELLEGIRIYALHQFGPLAKTVLNHWGVYRCEDFGEIVFNLVEAGVLGKTDQDKKEDFAGVYDFERVFRDPFYPSDKRKQTPRAQEP